MTPIPGDMAEAPPLDTLTAKQLGKHLRDVRRRKGLSLSEVARGAGLTRRELTAYEKGRIPIPDSDLFVLAGSCGVDVSDLRVVASPRELEAGPPAEIPSSVAAPQALPSSIEDTIAQLRRSREVVPPPVHAVAGRRRARAIEAASAPEPAPEPDTDWQIEQIDPLDAVHWPSDASIASPPTYATPSPAEPIDVFEELARLPEPLPLPREEDHDADLFASLPELLTPPPPGAVEDVDPQPYDEWATPDSDYGAEDTESDESQPVLVEMPNAQGVGAERTTAADAPPIDVAMRGESYVSPWDALQGTSGFETPADTPAAFGDAGFRNPFDPPPSPFSDDERASAVTDTWEPAPPAWDTPWSDPSAAAATPDTDPTAFDVREDDGWAEHGWTDQSAESLDTAAPAAAFDPRFAATPPVEAAPGPWAHEPDPEATNTGFYIDWGDPDADSPGVIGPGSTESDPLTPRPLGEPLAEAVVDGQADAEFEAEGEAEGDAALVTDIQAEADAEFVVEPVETWGLAVPGLVPDPDTQPDADPYAFARAEPEPDAYAFAEPALETGPELDAFAEADAEPEPAPGPEPEHPVVDDSEDELPMISWRPQWDETAAAAIGATVAAVAVALDSSAAAAAEPEPEPEPVEEFVVAGAEWVLGNAVPLVEVRSTGSLVMRRADERWALADVTAEADFALEAYVDLRSGPGFGLLFRALIDDEGRMSGYSFDVDPVYEGGSYLVREWRADRELWNPVAHVRASDPEAMHGLLAVRLTVDDDRLVASVNGTTVLEVDSLKQASVDRGREGASGNRVGIQAWSSTDLVIDELRVAPH